MTHQIALARLMPHRPSGPSIGKAACQGNPAHTVPEIWEASHGTVTAFCDFAGTGWTFAGLARAFGQRNPGIKGYGVEPKGAAALAGVTVKCPAHRIQGGGYAMAELPLLAGTMVDGYLFTCRDIIAQPRERSSLRP